MIQSVALTADTFEETMVSILVQMCTLFLSQNITAEGLTAKTNYEASLLGETSPMAMQLSNKLLTAVGKTLSKACFVQLMDSIYQPVQWETLRSSLPLQMSQAIFWSLGYQYSGSTNEDWLREITPDRLVQVSPA